MKLLVRNMAILVVAFAMLPGTGRSQEAAVTAPFTVASYRHAFDSALVAWSILTNLKSELRDTDEEYDFQSAFWPMELIGYKTSYVYDRLAFAFGRAASCSPAFQQKLVEVAYTNWPDTFRSQVRRIMLATDSPKVFATAAEYLWRGGRYPREKTTIQTLIQRKFDTVRNNAVLQMLRARLQQQPPGTMPPLTELFSEQFAPGLTVLYSFQRKDRDYPGLAVVRMPDGHFVRNPDGSVFSIPQLGRSITDLPFYLTNGNTPQGIYRMSGFARSSSRFIGPTTDIQLSVPYEIPVDSFLVTPAPGDTLWTADAYRSLLPGSWRNYAPAFEAYFAGKAGRTAIIAHGTTINPEYYRGRSFYPQTPSQGCLCAHESWDPVTGVRLESDQQKLVDAIRMAGGGTGYGCVIELGDAHTPVSIGEIMPFILQAEKNL